MRILVLTLTGVFIFCSCQKPSVKFGHQEAGETVSQLEGASASSSFVSCLGDFNNDGYINTSDLSALLGNVGTSNSDYDLNSNGVIDTHDVDWLTNHYGECEGAIYPANCSVDLDNNSHVNAGDLGAFLSQHGLEGAGHASDFDQNNRVDDADLQIFISYFGDELPASCEEVAEIFDTCLGDFNLDGTINTADTVALLGNIGGSELQFDLNANGTIDTDDSDWLTNHYGVCEGAIFLSNCAADLNEDGVVSASDLGAFLGQFGQVGDDIISDLDQNGVVDAKDQSIFINYFGDDTSSCF
jgi:hypothetical protein